MDSPSPSSSKSRKRRQRDEEEESPGESELDDQSSISLENNLQFTDTMIALRIMRAQFPRIDKVSIQPFILRSQLYSSVKDRTQVDRELESLKREKVLRIFKLNTGQDDHAVLFMDDYLNQVEHIVKRMEAMKKDTLAVFEWFKVHVIHSKLDPSIGHQELCSLLAMGGNVTDEDISLLINAGLLMVKLLREKRIGVTKSIPGYIFSSWSFWSILMGGLQTRQLIDPNMYWFAIPNIGSVLKGLSQGRNELLSLLKRKKYKEMMLAPLEKKRLRLSLLDMRFHLRDLLGSGQLKSVQTASGLVIRVAKD